MDATVKVLLRRGIVLRSRRAATPVDRLCYRVELPGRRPKHDLFRILTGTTEFGAAWEKKSDKGNYYLSVKLDDPSFPAPIYASLVADGDTPGLIQPDQLRLSAGVSVAGVVAVVTLAVSAVSAASALRTAVRAMLGAQDKPNLVVGKLHELAGLVGIAAAVLVSAVLTLSMSTITDRLAAWSGHPDAAGPTVRVLGVLVSFVVDGATFVLVVRVLAGQKPPWQDLTTGSAIAAVGLGVLRLLGTSVVSGSLRTNPVLAPFAVLVVLLAWVNLLARIVLTAAAWTADPPLEQPDEPSPAEGDGREEPGGAEQANRARG